MHAALRAAIAGAAATVLLALAACGGDEPPADGGPASGSRTLTLYSSLPLQGPDGERSRDMVDAIKLALQQAGGKAGTLAVTYVTLDSSTPEAGGWDADKVLDNARQAVRDLNAIAYVGERDSAATALSLPLTNEGHLLHVSPTSTYDGLTRSSRRQGEPDRFYPSGRRTFARMLPADHVQAAALVAYMRRRDVRRLALLADRDLYGGGLADQLVEAAEAAGLTVVDLGRIDAGARDLGASAARVAEARADAFLFAGASSAAAARVYRAVAAADRDAQLFGPAALVDATFADALPAAVRRRMRITSPILPARRLPAAARAFASRFRATFGRAPAPEALPAYEATAAVLHAIRAAGPRGNERQAVIDAFFAIRDRDSVLGRYSIDARGDTSLSRYAGGRLSADGLVLDVVLDVTR